MNYSTSFIHTARVKYGVDFKNSRILDIIEGLRHLRQNMVAGIDTGLHVGLQISLQDVDHIQRLIHEIIHKYKTDVSVNLPIKIQTVIMHLREVEVPNTKDIVKEVIVELISPEKPTKALSRKKQIQIDAAASSRQHALKIIKNSAKITPK